MSNILAKEISRFVGRLLDAGDEIIHVEAAEEFVADNSELVQQHFMQMVIRQITNEIKNRAQAPAKAFGQGVLFEGLPAAVTIAEGRTKPLKACTWDDLQIGRTFREDNIVHARDALKAYDADLAILAPAMQSSGCTVADAIAEVAA